MPSPSDVAAPAERRATYREVLAHPDVRLLVTTNLVSVLAGALRTVALSFLVYEETGSVFLTALTYGLTFVPEAFGGVLMGALPDRVRPKRLVVAGYVAEFIVGVTAAMGTSPLLLKFAMLVALGAVTPAFRAAGSKVIAESLPGDAYVLGRSLTAVTIHGGQLIGLAGGAAIVGGFGARATLVLAAALQLGAAGAAAVGLRDIPATPVSGSVLRQSWAGTHRLLAERRLRVLLAAQWLPPALMAGVEALIVPYANGLGFTTATTGLLLACLPVGMIGGDLAVARLVRPGVRGRLVVPLVTVMGAALVPFGADPAPVACCMLLAVAGIGNAYMLGVQGPFRDVVPASLLGQSFALLGTGLMVLQGVGPMIFGALAEWTAPGWSIATAGALTLVVAAGLRTPWRLFDRPEPSAVDGDEHRDGRDRQRVDSAGDAST